MYLAVSICLTLYASHLVIYAAVYTIPLSPFWKSTNCSLTTRSLAQKVLPRSRNSCQSGYFAHETPVFENKVPQMGYMYFYLVSQGQFVCGGNCNDGNVKLKSG
jgi:hypothetical protein